MGRKTIYNNTIADNICFRLAGGESLKSVCRDPKMPSVQTIYDWLNRYDEFLNKYRDARDKQLETYADEIIEIADDARNDWVEREGKNGKYTILNNEHVLRSRLRIDTRKWIAERLKPKKYGTKTELFTTGEVVHTHFIETDDLNERLNQLSISKN